MFFLLALYGKKRRDEIGGVQLGFGYQVPEGGAVAEPAGAVQHEQGYFKGKDREQSGA